MNIRQISKRLEESGIEPNEAKREAEMMVMHYLGLNSTDLVLNPEFDTIAELDEALSERINTGYPIQYILGEAYFMGEMFKVNKGVLIPRDETEILTRHAILTIKQNNLTNVLDIGTGTGCIACTIAKNCEVKTLGVDISPEALSVALENSEKLKTFMYAAFRKSDLFSNIHNDEKFDLIISNPPYIPIKNKESLQKEVRFEPELALFANDSEGIIFYKKIIEGSEKYLNKGGYIMFELGINQSQLVKSCLEEHNFTEINIIKDFAGIDRVISAKK